jgi:hypothetical protein
VIDIGRSFVPENRKYHSNQVAPERQDNYAPPPYADSFK